MQRLVLLLLSVTLAACVAGDPTPHVVEPHHSTARPPELRPLRIAKFGRTFSVHNDGVAALDAAYRDLERGMTAHHCLECHSEDAGTHREPWFATKAFELRHNIVVVLEANVMPPVEFDGHVGIADEKERLKLLALAQAFEAAGDAALTREVELP